ncbi:NAD(P)-dependent glycerol-3-phosphate dehydrogenase [Mesorhizobium sp. RP14(2022)]|uniref:Glycerol-3-phosphate dehydrogenase [NAD(P)+] n=1 Tax=Mesorhizobium liriopis TaxID=2953882 RepID=A0ABT1C8J5_9HYPH|nr:NAD(P)H-dependent glycerol-3-phosphate dehydrogenase [Mesorhizobium liriopis]MCO6051168.1 NAD(P)-dependent glycerol-3-phosphate dehydrogenase [Mesorhizobium liriopis]
MTLAVIGAGAWGTALALAAARAEQSVRLWARDGTQVQAMRETGENAKALPGVPLGSAILPTADLSEALSDAEAVLVVVPAQTLRQVLPQLAPHLAPLIPLVLCAKGIERDTGLLPSDIARETTANPLLSLSGPSFAADVGRGLPTAVVVGAQDEALAGEIARFMSSGSFRCYSNGDLRGVEAGGALKNVFALAAGAAAGAGLGASAQAALVTRGFVELRRLATRLGANPETIMGLSGLGDLLLTCSSAQSRNFAYGLALGRGESREGLKLAEGVPTAGIAAHLAVQHGIEAPIINAVTEILAGRLTIGDAVEALMTRPLKSEDI